MDFKLIGQSMEAGEWKWTVAKIGFLALSVISHILPPQMESTQFKNVNFKVFLSMLT